MRGKGLMQEAKRITVDALPLMSSGGISNYVRPLLAAFAAHAGKACGMEYLFRLGFRQHRRGSFEASEDGKVSDAAIRVTGWPDIIVERFWLDWACHGHRPSVFLSTTEFVPFGKGVRKVWIVYDLVPARLPQFFPGGNTGWLQSMLRRSERADYIVAISETTRRDVVELLGYPENQIEVIYPGVPPSINAKQVSRGLIGRKRPYVCYLGALALNKNVDGLLRIFAKCVHEYGIDVDLVITGRNFCGDDYWAALINELGIGDRVQVKGWVTDEERRAILSGARMLWQFSWYEGFGLPVLEAAACGVPALCSNRGALNEILLNADQEIDPSDISGAAEKAANALGSDLILKEWSALGCKRAREFSWDKSATKLLSVIDA